MWSCLRSLRLWDAESGVITAAVTVKSDNYRFCFLNHFGLHRTNNRRPVLYFWLLIPDVLKLMFRHRAICSDSFTVTHFKSLKSASCHKLHLKECSDIIHLNVWMNECVPHLPLLSLILLVDDVLFPFPARMRPPFLPNLSLLFFYAAFIPFCQHTCMTLYVLGNFHLSIINYILHVSRFVSVC